MALSDILTKIQNFVNAKAVPNPDPARVSAAELSEVLTDIAEFADDVSNIDIARTYNDRGLMTNYDVWANFDGLIPPGTDTTEITWINEPVFGYEFTPGDPESDEPDGWSITVEPGVSMDQGGITYTDNGVEQKVWVDLAAPGTSYLIYLYANHQGGTGADKVRFLVGDPNNARETSTGTSTYSDPDRILAARVRVYNDRVEFLPGAQVKRVRLADGTIIEAKQDGTLPLPEFGAGGGAVLATEAEEIAGTVTDKSSTPGGRSSWWASVLAGATTYFSQNLAALKFELGKIDIPGASRVIEAIGSLSDISISLKFKGAGLLKLDGLSYTFSGNKILILTPSGEVVAQFDTSEEQVAVPPALNAPGIPGTWAADTEFLYFCKGVATWFKIPTLSSTLNYGELTTAVPLTTTQPAGEFVGQVAYDLPAGRRYEWIGTQWVWSTINGSF